MGDGTEISLDLFARVTAGRSEGWSLRELLEHEQVDEDDWVRGELAWADRMSASAETDLAVIDEVDRAVAAQRALFARVVAPLDDDLAAFVAVQRAIERSSLKEVLGAHGLHLGDWLRLQERWATRASAEPEVRAAWLELMGRDDLPVLRVVAAPRVLPPPIATRPVVLATGVVSDEVPPADDVPWGLPALGDDEPALPFHARDGGSGRPAETVFLDASVAPAEAATPFDEEMVVRYARISAELAARTEPPDHVLARHGLDAAGKARLDADVSARLKADAGLRRRYMEALMEHGRSLRGG